MVYSESQLALASPRLLFLEQTQVADDSMVTVPHSPSAVNQDLPSTPSSLPPKFPLPPVPSPRLLELKGEKVERRQSVSFSGPTSSSKPPTWSLLSPRKTRVSYSESLGVNVDTNYKVFGNATFEARSPAKSHDGHVLAWCEDSSTQKTDQQQKCVPLPSPATPRSPSPRVPTPRMSIASGATLGLSPIDTTANGASTPTRGGTPRTSLPKYSASRNGSPRPGGSNDGGVAQQLDSGTDDTYASTIIKSPKAHMAFVKTVEQFEAELVGLLPRERDKALALPGPTSGRVQCYIKGSKGFLGTNPVYNLYLESGQQFLLAARRRKKSRMNTWVLSRHIEDLKRDTDNCVGKLKANFVGTEYTLYGKSGDPHVKKGYATEHMSLHFKQSVLASTEGPRTMFIGLPVPGQAWQGTTGPGGADSLQRCVDLARLKELPPFLEKKLLMLCNKPPEFDENLKAFTLDFEGRVKEPSVKNMQLVPWDHNTDSKGRDIILQFGKITEEEFCLDFAYPLNALTAFAIALSSIDTKLCYAL